MFRPALASLLGSLIACTVPEPDADPAELDALWSRYEAVLVAGDLEGYAGLYSPEARLAAPEVATLSGRTAIRDFAAPFFQNYRFTRLAVRPDVRHIHGNQGYEFGTYEEDMTAADTVHTIYGRYATAVRRGAEGTWTIDWLLSFEDSTVVRQ
jgi:uncharacterized protein (TIGR02246 family)